MLCEQEINLWCVKPLQHLFCYNRLHNPTNTDMMTLTLVNDGSGTVSRMEHRSTEAGRPRGGCVGALILDPSEATHERVRESYKCCVICVMFCFMFCL